MGFSEELNYGRLSCNYAKFYTLYDIKEIYRSLTGSVLDREVFKWILFTNKYKEISGIAIYCDNNGYSSTMHVHMPKQVTRNNLKQVLSFPFHELGNTKLFLEIKSTAHKTVSIAEKLGFKIIANLADKFGKDKNSVIMVATKNDLEKWVT